MYRGYDYYSNPQYGWNTTSPDYLEHVNRMQRTPSVITDVPPHPNVHLAFQNKATYQPFQNKAISEGESGNHRQQVDHHKHQAPEAQKKVHFTETEKTTEVVKNAKDEVRAKEDINQEADGFIKKEHGNFELFKWRSFKAS